MYISAVSGHRSAAMAIEKAIKLLSPETQVLSLNAFSYTNPISEKIINRLYMGVVNKVPQIWNYLYDNPSVARKLEKIKNTIHEFNSPKLKKLFDDFNPDVVICTQAFPCGMVADFKRIYDSNIKLIAVLTDYVPHAYWIYDSVDFYISASDEVTKRLVQKGVALEKIKQFGIPFDHKFNENIDRDSVLKKLDLETHLPTLLIMGGGHGLGPIKTIVKFLEQSKRDLQEIVVTGINTKLYNSLKSQIKRYNKRIVILGFVDNINELMSSSDIIITKPGGITTAEALAKRIPMIIIRPLPGQEASNTAYLVEKGAAVKIDDLNNINTVVEDLLSDFKKLNLIGESAGIIGRPNASLDIANHLLQLPNV